MIDAEAVQKEYIAATGCWCLLRLAHHGKKPIDEGWTSGPRRWPYIWQGKVAGWQGNLGLPTGLLPSGLYLVGADFDEYMPRVQDFMADLFVAGVPNDAPTTITPGRDIPGSHRLWLSDEEVPSRNLIEGVEIKCEGRQLVVPPSENGRGPYTHEDGYGLDFPIPLLSPAAKVALGVREHIRAAPTVTSRVDENNNDMVAVACELFGFHSPRWRADGTVELWRSGNDTRDHLAATVGQAGPGRLHMFTPNVPGLEADRTYSRWELYKLRGKRDPRLQRIRDAVPKYTTDKAFEDWRERRKPDGLYLVTLDAVRAEHVDYFDEPWIPLRVNTIVCGVDGIGKSTILYDKAARATRGELDGTFRGVPVRVAIASAEDHDASVIKPRMAAAGADLSMVDIVKYRRHGFDSDISLPDDVDDLARELVNRGVRLLILDPLISHLDFGRIDSHRAQDIRAVLAPLAHLAERERLACASVVHFNKAGTVDASLRLSGSKAIRDAARSVLVCGAHPSEKDTYVVVQDKHSFGPKPTHGVTYTIETANVKVDGETFTTSRVVWGEPVEIDATALIAGSGGGREPSKIEQAITLLEDWLTERAHKVADLKTAAEDVGISWRTVESAKAKLGVRSIQVAVSGKRGPGPSWWFLPNGPTPDSLTADCYGPPDDGSGPQHPHP